MQKDNQKIKLDFEGQQNLFGFFELLLKVDQRNNPELYKNNNKEKYDRHSNTEAEKGRISDKK